MSTDERPESLAAQAAAWVPPWERQQAAPDPAYAAAVRAAADDDLDDDIEDDDADTDPAHADGADGGAADGGGADDGEVPAEVPPMPGEVTGPVTVDAPQRLPGEDEPDPTDVELAEPDVVAPGLPDPDDVPQDAPVDGAVPVDAPVPVDREDAGNIFDAAADDISVDDIDLPAVESGEADAPRGQGGPGERGGAGEQVGLEEQNGLGEHSEFGTAVGPAARKASRAEGKAERAAKAKAADRVASGIPAQARGKGDTGPPAGAAGRRTVAGSASVVDAAGGAAHADEDDTLPPIDDSELRAALEAILLVVDEPVGELQLAQIMEQPAERVAAMLEDISASYTAAGHGFDLRRAAGGWRLYTRPEYAPYVERFVLDGQSTRLTQAALETLAVVAYRQPVTRSRISAIRGVNCDGVMRTLVTRGLIEECGTESETGAFLYRTTVLFLEKLGLNSVDQLPNLAPFLPDDLEEVFDAQR